MIRKAYYREKKIEGQATRAYQFVLYLDNNLEPIRGQKTCSKEAVDDYFNRWVKKNIEISSSGIKNHRFFKILDKYMAWLPDNKSSSQVSRERSALGSIKKWFKNLFLNDIKKYHVEDYVAVRKKNPNFSKKGYTAPSTIQKETAMLSYFFYWCIDRGYMKDYNPAKRIKLKLGNQRIVSLTEAQEEELFEKANSYLFTAILIARYTGARRREITNLKWSDVDLEGGLIHFKNYLDEKGEHTLKSKRSREVPIPRRLLDYLKSIEPLMIDKNVHLLRFKGHPIKNFYKGWSLLRDKLSFRILSDGNLLRFHDLRHCYGTWLARKEMSVFDIQKVMGHKNIQTTLKYIDYVGVDIKEKFKRIDDYSDIKEKSAG